MNTMIDYDTIDKVSFKGKVFDIPEDDEEQKLFKRCDFSEATFTNTHLKETIFIKCQFDFTKFKDTKFTECRFIGCKFDNSEFYQNTFVDCEFVDCIFGNVIIDKSEFLSIVIDFTFNGCRFERMVISNTTLNGVSFLSSNFIRTYFNSSQFNTNKERYVYSSSFKSCIIDLKERHVYSSSFKSCIIDLIGMNATIGTHIDFIGCNINTLDLDYSTLLDITFDTTSCNSFDASSSVISNSRFYNGRTFFASEYSTFTMCDFKRFNLDNHSYFRAGSRLDSCKFDDVTFANTDLGVLVDCKFVEKITVIGGHIRNWLSKRHDIKYAYYFGTEPIKENIEISEISENGIIDFQGVKGDDFSIFILSPKYYDDDAFADFHNKNDCGLTEKQKQFLNAYINVDDDMVLTSDGITYTISDYLDKVSKLAVDILDDDGIENAERTIWKIQRNVNFYNKYLEAVREENDEEFEKEHFLVPDVKNEEKDKTVKPKYE